MNPVEYEVQGVTHESVEGVYKTYANVSVYVDYSKIEITEAVMEEQ